MKGRDDQFLWIRHWINFAISTVDFSWPLTFMHSEFYVRWPLPCIYALPNFIIMYSGIYAVTFCALQFCVFWYFYAFPNFVYFMCMHLIRFSMCFDLYAEFYVRWPLQCIYALPCFMYFDIYRHSRILCTLVFICTHKFYVFLQLYALRILCAFTFCTLNFLYVETFMHSIPYSMCVDLYALPNFMYVDVNSPIPCIRNPI